MDYPPPPEYSSAVHSMKTFSDEVKVPLLNNEIRVDVQGFNNTLFADDSSNRKFASLDEKFKKEVTQVELQVRATTQSNVNAMQEALSSSDLLQGLLFPNERQLEVQPLYLSFINCEGWKQASIYAAFALMTNSRMILMKVAKAERSSLATEKTSRCVVTDEVNVGHTTYDGNFFYPIPLKNIHGMSFRNSYVSEANQSIQKRRYAFLIALMFLLFVAAVITVFATIFNANMMPSDQQLTLDVVLPILLFFAVVAGVGFFCCTYFRQMPMLIPLPTQSKTIELGFVDPLTQKNVVAYLELQPSYSIHEAKKFLSILQLQCPQLSGL